MGLRGPAIVPLLLLTIACSTHEPVSAAGHVDYTQRMRSPLTSTRTLTQFTPIPATTHVPDPGTATAPTGTATGLQDATLPINGTVPSGHFLSGIGLWASTAYSYPSQLGGFKASSPGVWGQVRIHAKTMMSRHFLSVFF